MDFKQIEAFVNVVRYKSFSKAADATFFTQPTISTHISNLETELGAKLLDRRGRTVEMTPNGAKFYKYAVDMINARTQALEIVGHRNAEISGILEIQTSSIPGVTFLPEYLADFRKDHKDVQYYVSLSDTQAVIDNIIDRRGEIGFVGEKLSSNLLDYTRVFTDSVVMLAPACYDLPDSISMKEAIEHPFLWRESGSATRKNFEATAIKMGYDKTAFDIAGLFTDLNSIIRSVEHGLGVTVLSKSVAASIINSNLKIVEIESFNSERDFYMIHLKNHALSPAAEAFSSYVKNIACSGSEK